MISLKKIAIVSSLAAVTAGGMVGAASAQPGRYYDRGGYDNQYNRGGYDNRFNRGDRLSTANVDSLNWRIQNAARQGRISWPQARDLQNRLNDVKPIAWRYQTGEARPWEINRLERTVDMIMNVIRG